MTVHVRITRSKHTRVLSARAVQHDAERDLVGGNLLAGRKLMRIAAAKAAVRDRFRGLSADLEFDIQASPDLEEPYRLGEDCKAVRREVRS